ncbi:hypothetical protein [Candidatus Nitrososphaera gargensis]|nr:hypothetical protein [Candidatus Nitrososphaera gargensis]
MAVISVAGMATEESSSAEDGDVIHNERTGSNYSSQRVRVK